MRAAKRQRIKGVAQESCKNKLFMTGIRHVLTLGD